MASSPRALCHRAQSSFITEASAPVPDPGRLGRGEGVDRAGAEHFQSHPGPGDLLAQRRIGAPPPGSRHDVVELAPELDLLAEGRRAALDSEQVPGHFPALSRLAEHEVSVGPGTVEEDLVELAGPGQLADRPDRDPRLAHRHEQHRQPAAAPRTWLGPGQHEAPVGDVRQRCPDLLAGDLPVVTGKPSGRGDRRQVRAGAGLGESLAPQLGHRRDGGQETAPLLRRAEGDQRRAEQLLAHVTDPGRRVSPGVLLVEDHLLADRRAAPAVLGWPAQRGPAGRRQAPVPGQPLLERLMFPAGTAGSAQPGELAGQVRRQPVAEPGAELLVAQARQRSRRAATRRRADPAAAARWPAPRVTGPGAAVRWPGSISVSRRRRRQAYGRRLMRGAPSLATSDAPDIDPYSDVAPVPQKIRPRRTLHDFDVRYSPDYSSLSVRSQVPGTPDSACQPPG